MAFGFPAHYSKHHHPGVHDPEYLREGLIRTIGKLGWDLKKEGGDKLIATCGVELWSWGEVVRIDIQEDLSLSVTSKCAFPLQCLDHGKNEENVEFFLVELNKVLEEG